MGNRRRWPPDYWRGMSWRLWLAHWITFRTEILEQRKQSEKRAGVVRPEDVADDPAWQPPTGRALDLIPLLD